LAELRDAKQACVSWFANGMKFRLRRGFGLHPPGCLPPRFPLLCVRFLRGGL